MTTAEFAALDSAALADFLEDNGFPEEADATSVFRRVADGELTPAALADFLGDANAAMFNPPIIGAEVYRWTGQSLQTGKTTATRLGRGGNAPTKKASMKSATVTATISD